MPGRKKKSTNSSKSSGSKPKYSVSPITPVKTRSSSQAAAFPVADPSVPAAPPSVASEISALESRFDERMSKMETTIRDSLTAAMMSSAATPVPTASTLMPPPPPPVVAPAAPPQLPVQQSAVVATPSRSSSLSSTLSVRSRERSTSFESSASSSRNRRSRRSHRSPRRSPRRSSRNKHGKYTTLKYVPEHKVIVTYERLVLANLRMLLKFYKKDRDIKGMLKHSILLAEKADADVFHNDALISYDDSIEALASEEGIDAFSKLDPAAIVKHLSYDGTKAARAAKQRVSSGRQAAAPRPASSNTTSACFKFNFASGGCRRSKCNYPHVCSACSGTGHVNADCPNVDRTHEKSGRK